MTQSNTVAAASLRAGIAACAEEPIHIPGSIQPHGYLLAADPRLQVTQVSQNLEALTGIPLATLLGMPLSNLIGALPCKRLAEIEAGHGSSGILRAPLYIGSLPHPTIRSAPNLAILAHQHDGMTIVELEADAPPETLGTATLYPLVKSFVASVQGVEQIADLSLLVAREIGRITGFGRVLVYRFDADGHGQVLAEQCEPGYSSFLDHHFPAADIPEQARALYLKSHLRLIADARYQPVPILPALNPATGKPLDLSLSATRSVSPVHVEYMKNMGTMASMSISLVVRGRLWGLVSCHDHAARIVPYPLRTACEHIGQVFSLQIEAKEDREDAAYRLELRRTLVRLLAAVSDHDNLHDGLAASPHDLLRFTSATGAAVVSDGRVACIGETPNQTAILALADWLSLNAPDTVFQTDSLSRDCPVSLGGMASPTGLLAVSISQLFRNYVMWFRPEVIKHIKWAGDPQKVVESALPTQTSSAAADSDDLTEMPGAPLRIAPRLSFATWLETVRGRSLRWRSSEIETAREFRTAMLAIVLKRAETMAQFATELGRANRELEAFSYSVSHDLRAPLRHIVGYGDLLGETESAALSERGVRYLKNITDSARFAGTLVDDLLKFSQMGRAALRLAKVDLNSLVGAVVRELQADAGSRQIEWRVADLPEVTGDAVFLQLAVRNLLANAVKYTRNRALAIIEVDAPSTESDYVFRVRDNGVGFNMKYQHKLFGVFQRLHRFEDFEGTGIGLANVRRIVERHDGRAWAEGEIDLGATFYFSLPRQLRLEQESPRPLIPGLGPA